MTHSKYRVSSVIGFSLPLVLVSCGRISFESHEQHQCTYPPPGTCAPTDLGSVVGMAVTAGRTSGPSGEQPSCLAGEAADAAFMWTAPASGRYTFDTRGSSYDTVLHARLGTCAGPEMACNDDMDGTSLDSSVELEVARGDRIVFFVDGVGAGAEGDFVVNILGTERDRCGDGADNDLDGAIDCADSDCQGSVLCREDSRCFDGEDNDFDNQIDCADSDCACARACATICEATPLSGVGTPIATVNHEGACGGLLAPSCMGTSATMRTFRWAPATAGRYRIDTFGGQVETSLSVHVGSCAGPELACNADWESGNDAAVVLDLTANQEVFIVVASRWGKIGDVPLNIARSEEGLCLDGLDNDGDGQLDCADTDCRNRPACTEVGLCADMQDNDGDGATDCADPATSTRSMPT